MTEAEWLECTEPDRMLEALRGKISERKLRLFVCACCRRIWHLLPHGPSRAAVEAAEHYADGLIEEAERKALWFVAFHPLVGAAGQGRANTLMAAERALLRWGQGGEVDGAKRGALSSRCAMAEAAGVWPLRRTHALSPGEVTRYVPTGLPKGSPRW